MMHAPATTTTHAPEHRQFRTPGGSLGLTAMATEDLVRQIEVGLPFKALQSLATASGLPVAEIASTVGIPDRTLARRKAAGRFASHESERLLRIATIFEKALDLFEGDVTDAVKWLSTPQRIFANRTPLAYSHTEPGAREVENLIGRLEHGVFS